MRKMSLLFVLVLAGAWARPSLAACPGTEACVYNQGCPRGSTRVAAGQSIQKAIKAAPSTGVTLCVAPGTYTGLINFQGKPINLVSSGGPAVTFLDGGGAGPVVTFSSAEGKDSILNGFTVRNGSAPYGAGIYIKEASPTIRNSILTGNTATGNFGRGGGIGVTGVWAHPSITCTRFLGNKASYAGGGLMSTYSANPYLRSNLFRGNQPRTAARSASTGAAASISGGLNCSQIRQALTGAGFTSAPLMATSWSAKPGSRATKPVATAAACGSPRASRTSSTPPSTATRRLEGGGIAAGYGSMVNVASTLFVRNTSNPGSATLVNALGSNTSVVNHYNGFFGNTGPDFANTYGDQGLLIPGADPLGGSCCPAPGSPAINAGIPDLHFNDPDGSPNDMGACGGPALSTFGIMR